jgi:hypothetical protein
MGAHVEKTVDTAAMHRGGEKENHEEQPFFSFGWKNISLPLL